MPRLTGKRAVITGGAQGIGRGIADGFLQEGAEVAVIDIQPESAAKDLITAAERSGGRAFYFRADVASEEQVAAAMTAAATALSGGVDILLNNAGIVGEHPVTVMTVAEWDRVLAVNLRGPFLCARAALPGMIEQGHGRIINIASQLGQLGGETMAHYCASKAGLIGFTKALAREVSHAGILVNAIAPGPIETAMLASESADWVRRKLAQLPMRRFGLVTEVVPTAVSWRPTTPRITRGRRWGRTAGT